MTHSSALDLEGLRQREFARLDATGTVYLDYAGAALYPVSLVRQDARRLTTRILGNPHAGSAPSLASTRAIDTARALTLQLLDANPADYEVVFTANASGAIRILAEAFPFRAGSRLVMTADNHNSVNGLRVAARRRRAVVEYVPLTAALRSADPRPWLTPATAPSLFAFPAQSNFSGVRHCLGWVRDAQHRGYRVLLDAAAFAGSHALSLSAVPADFAVLSFYKLFGYPTGVGALVARRDALAMLRRNYFGGGTVQFVSVQNRLARAREGSEAFEDGTPHFLAMHAVCDGLRWLRTLGMAAITRHVAARTDALLDRFAGLGKRVEVYGPRDLSGRGGTIAFNLVRNRRILPHEDVEVAARSRGIAIRGGCFCNPGAAEQAFAMAPHRARVCLRGAFSIPRLRACLGDGPVGALRASVGVATTITDLDRLIDCAVELTDASATTSTRGPWQSRRAAQAIRE